MKILFLDIDGVLNSTDNMAAINYLCKQNNNYKSRDRYGIVFDERCVKWLHFIVLKTDCKIVISSTWKMNGIASLKNMWLDRQLPGKIIGCTPNIVDERLGVWHVANTELNLKYKTLKIWKTII